MQRKASCEHDHAKSVLAGDKEPCVSLERVIGVLLGLPLSLILFIELKGEVNSRLMEGFSKL